ncbi:MAG: hypothetical protein JXQ83_09500, partial [Candidatus Glassbacteria bacterium]|nr:hypothetical protein [Candidatus Glassbacteria bacterium]
HEMIRQIDFGCEPTQVRVDELKAIHRGLLTVKSIHRVAGFLAAEICASLDGDSAVGQTAADLLACAGLAADRERWAELYAKASGDGPQAAGGDRAVKPETGLKKTEKLNPKKLLKKLRGLVERMEGYRKSLERTSTQGGVPNRVLARQKELFALKAALLLALLKMEGFASRELTALAGKAQVLAGESWDEVAGDFVHRPAAGGPA